MMGDAVTTITITAIVIMLIATIVVGRSTQEQLVHCSKGDSLALEVQIELNGDRVVVKEGIDLKRKRKMGMLIVSFYVQLVLV